VRALIFHGYLRGAEEGGPATGSPLRHLHRYLRSLDGQQRARYLTAATALADQVVWTGKEAKSRGRLDSRLWR
jgi:hypothetical protein